MFVVTMDQRGSSSGPDLVEGLVEGLNAEGPSQGIVRPFQRTAGDEVQGLLDRAEAVVGIALSAARSGHWSVGIGVGPVREPMPRETRAGAGPAFEHARDAVERAKHSPGRVAVSASSSAPLPGPARTVGTGRTGLDEAVEASLQLLAELEYRRSEEGQDAGRLVDAGLTQREAAERLGITQQAVSSRLRSGLWHETRRLASVAAGQLEALDAQQPDGRSEQGGAR
jgi:hypothetical protein